MQRTIHIAILATSAVLSTAILGFRIQTRILLSRRSEVDIHLRKHGRESSYKMATLPDSIISDAAPTASLSVSVIIAVIALLLIVFAWPKKTKKVS